MSEPAWRRLPGVSRGSGEVSAHSAYLQWGLHPKPLTPLALAYRPLMSRRSLRPQLNQIRGWVRQGRTDAWIAHQLDVTVQQIQAFKREQELRGRRRRARSRPYEEVDLRAEDDAAIAAELEEEAAKRAEEEAKAAEEAARKAAEEEERRGRRGRATRTRRTRSPSARRRSRGGAARARRTAARPARGHLRPRRGGLRPVARPRRAGRSRLRRALGGPPPRRDHDRGGPDRDPPRRRWRGRRRRLSRRSRAGDRLAARASTRASATWSSRRVRHVRAAHVHADVLGLQQPARRGAGPGVSADALVHAADVAAGRACAPAVEVEDEEAGQRLRPGFEALGWAAERLAWLRLDGPPTAGRTSTRSRSARRATCASSGRPSAAVGDDDEAARGGSPSTRTTSPSCAARARCWPATTPARRSAS